MAPSLTWADSRLHGHISLCDVLRVIQSLDEEVMKEGVKDAQNIEFWTKDQSRNTTSVATAMRQPQHISYHDTISEICRDIITRLQC